MLQLVSVLLVIILIYFVQGKYPVMAGFMAVIPVKIICTSLFAHERGVFNESLKGMLIGQFIVGFILLIIYMKG